MTSANSSVPCSGSGTIALIVHESMTNTSSAEVVAGPSTIDPIMHGALKTSTSAGPCSRPGTVYLIVLGYDRCCSSRTSFRSRHDRPQRAWCCDSGRHQVHFLETQVEWPSACLMAQCLHLTRDPHHAWTLDKSRTAFWSRRSFPKSRQDQPDRACPDVGWSGRPRADLPRHTHGTSLIMPARVRPAQEIHVSDTSSWSRLVPPAHGILVSET